MRSVCSSVVLKRFDTGLLDPREPIVREILEHLNALTAHISGGSGLTWFKRISLNNVSSSVIFFAARWMPWREVVALYSQLERISDNCRLRSGSLGEPNLFSGGGGLVMSAEGMRRDLSFRLD